MSDDSLSRLEQFFAAVRRTNPFAADPVEGPPGAGADVERLGAAPFDRLTALAREACEQNQGRCAVLTGAPGTGKSHLLARLERWAGQGGRA